MKNFRTNQNFNQTKMPILRTFKSWHYELKSKYPLLYDIAKLTHTVENFEMYYKGGYSPFMVMNELFNLTNQNNLS